MYRWDFSFLGSYQAAIALGLWNTISITVLSIIAGTAIAVLMVAGQLSSNHIIRYACRIYVEIFVSLPILVLLVWLYYCLPLLGLNLSAFVTAVTALSLSLSAFVAELVRGAVLTIPSGQVEAARILGFSSYHTSKSIVWPQVLRSIAPALLNEYVTTLKLSTVASVISAPELLYQSGLIITQTYRPLEVYTTLAVLFAIIVIPLLRIGRVLEKRRIWKI
jgi:polar amino acid transport system permease protein